jgi:hypothetical protein
LLEKSQNIPTEAQEIPALKATIEGLQLLLQEKDERISDLKREAETLGIFAHYFKSLEYRRLEPQRTPESTHEDMVKPRPRRSKGRHQRSPESGIQGDLIRR